MKGRLPDSATERRLEEIRREARERGTVSAAGVRAIGSPLPKADEHDGYYQLPLLKAPTWTWEVPVYFFVGGAAGAAAMLAAAARLTGADDDLVRDARFIAAGGAMLSAPLLIADLGRPERFLNMLRVFKPQSAMSVGAWTLTAFGAASSAAAFAEVLRQHTDLPVTLIGDLAGLGSAAAGLGMATYTGVLVGATAIPVWSHNVRLLPLHFSASALGSAVSLLQLSGHDQRALQVLGLAVGAFETAAGYSIEVQEGHASDPLREGMSGVTTRLGGFFSGPLPLLLRLIGLRSKRARQAAAVSSLLGSLLTRFAWVEAGHVSAKNSHTGGGGDEHVDGRKA